MEEGTVILTISHLIQRACPLTAAAYSVPRSPISTLKPHKNPGGNYRQEESFRTCENPTRQTLKLLNYPAFLVGTLALPSFANCNSPIKCSCFQFSDDSATICCDILDFDPKMIGLKIRILAWNFIPLTCVCDVKDNSKTSSLIFGVIESISPVFVVPCVSGESGSRNISGFLVDVLVCQCKICVSKFLASELRDLTEEKVEDHSFTKRAIVYFSGLTSSWHPVISRFISNVILLTGLKQKLVFITKEESKLMYVTTDEVSLHVTKLFKEQGLSRNTDIKGKGEIGSYTGVITGIYMQGMVVELDQDVILLLTDQHLIVPHCVRVGAIVTLENVHFVDPKFPWAKMLILSACCRTSVYVESFSPLETRCHLKSHSQRTQTLLQKFINSLPFAARLWVLLVVSCFRKKFAGILPEKAILGSKHKEGLAQEYASSHLPLSAFQFRHGVLVEFCRHDSCSVGKEEQYFHLRLVLPIANLISYCEISWKKILVNRENFSDFVGDINQKKPLSCGGRSYMQSIRRVLRTEEIGILVLGTLKAKDFTLIMEGIPPDMVDSDLTICPPLSCRSIFSNGQPLRTMKISIYLYHWPTDDSRSHSLFFDWKGNSQELDSGKFHLLMLTHNIPFSKSLQNKYMMTPVSFITIDETSLISGHLTGESNHAHGTVGLRSNTSQSTVPPVLISDALQLSELKPMQFRCRKATATAVSQSCGCSILSAIEIPFADDGSSSCCCWADSERAAALLGLESEEILLEETAETFGDLRLVEGSNTTPLSGRSISSSEQDLLRSLTTKAFLSTSWTIVGSLMHPEASSWLEQRLTELDMAVPPLPNVWATSVNRTDVLAEARNMIQGLV
ncbi:UNVERIFIED_CONTAM: CST complex subunit CTC1 [Sesamum latifolium]|uniref:CST complex subunit CTC1 n=1 Tax=Sesamum latifolium TaxID=2727402 RepID=A0AAW2WBD8_9LAMI